MTNLPPIFIPSGVHGELLLGTADMWEHPEGRYVRAEDYLALKDEFNIIKRKLVSPAYEKQ